MNDIETKTVIKSMNEIEEHRKLCEWAFQTYFIKNGQINDISESKIWKYIETYFAKYASDEIKESYYEKWQKYCGKRVFEMRIIEVTMDEKQIYPIYRDFTEVLIRRYVRKYADRLEVNKYVNVLLVDHLPLKKRIDRACQIFKKITSAKTINDAHTILYSEKLEPNWLVNLLNVELLRYEITPFIKDVILSYEVFYNRKVEEDRIQRQVRMEEEKTQREQNNLNKAIKIIEYAVKNDITDFSILPSDSPYKKNDYVLARLFLRKTNHPLYTTYMTYVENNKRQKYEMLRPLIDQMLYYIDNGIVQNGIKRSFDIIDYYDMVPIDIDKLFNIVCEYLTADEVRKLKKGLMGDNKIRMFCYQSFSNEISYHNCKVWFDCSGTTLLVTSEECEDAFRELKNRGIFNDLTCSAAINRLKQQKINEFLSCQKTRKFRNVIGEENGCNENKR